MGGERSAEKIAGRLLVVSTLGLVFAACGGAEPPAKPPVPSPVAKDPAWLADATRSCARVASCIQSQERLRDPSACVDWWMARAEGDPLPKCLAGAATCEALQACLQGGGDARAATFCAGRTGVTAGCDGDRFVSCSDDANRVASVTDCAALGATCKEIRAGGLVQRGCYAASKCPAGGPELRCDGAQAVLSCHDGIFERTACRGGSTCEEIKDENGDPTAACVLKGTRCGLLGGKRCDGERLVECAGKVQRVTDCGALGLQCTGVGPRAACVVRSVECDRDMLPRCEAGAIVFCAAGRLARVPCASLGMGTCDGSARGALVACAAPKAPASK